MDSLRQELLTLFAMGGRRQRKKPSLCRMELLWKQWERSLSNNMRVHYTETVSARHVDQCRNDHKEPMLIPGTLANQLAKEAQRWGAETKRLRMHGSKALNAAGRRVAQERLQVAAMLNDTQPVATQQETPYTPIDIKEDTDEWKLDWLRKGKETESALRIPELLTKDAYTVVFSPTKWSLDAKKNKASAYPTGTISHVAMRSLRSTYSSSKPKTESQPSEGVCDGVLSGVEEGRVLEREERRQHFLGGRLPLSARHLFVTYLAAASPSNSGESAWCRQSEAADRERQVLLKMANNLRVEPQIWTDMFRPSLQDIWQHACDTNLEAHVEKGIGCKTRSTTHPVCASCVRKVLDHADSMWMGPLLPRVQLTLKTSLEGRMDHAASLPHSHAHSLFAHWVALQMHREALQGRQQRQLMHQAFSRKSRVQTTATSSTPLASGRAINVNRYRRWYRETVYLRLPEHLRGYSIGEKYRFHPAQRPQADLYVPMHEPPRSYSPTPGSLSSNPSVLLIAGISVENVDALELFREFVAAMHSLTSDRMRIDCEKTRAQLFVSPSAMCELTCLSINKTRVNPVEMKDEVLRSRRDPFLRRLALATLPRVNLAVGWQMGLAATPRQKCGGKVDRKGGFAESDCLFQLPKTGGDTSPCEVEHIENWHRERRTSLVNTRLRPNCGNELLRRGAHLEEDSACLEEGLLVESTECSAIDLFVSANAKAVNGLHTLCYLLRSAVAVTIIALTQRPDGTPTHASIFETLQESWSQIKTHEPRDSFYCASYDDLFLSIALPFGVAIDTLWRLALNLAPLETPEKVDARLHPTASFVMHLWEKNAGTLSGLQLIEAIERALFGLTVGDFSLDDGSYLLEFAAAWESTARAISSCPVVG